MCDSEIACLFQQGFPARLSILATSHHAHSLRSAVLSLSFFMVFINMLKISVKFLEHIDLKMNKQAKSLVRYYDLQFRGNDVWLF